MYEVTIPQLENSTRIMIPFDIPTPLVEGGAVELYASVLCHWTPTIIIDGVETPNPVSAINAVAERLRGQVKDSYLQLLKDKAAVEARVAAEEQFNALFQ